MLCSFQLLHQGCEGLGCQITPHVVRPCAEALLATQRAAVVVHEVAEELPARPST